MITMAVMAQWLILSAGIFCITRLFEKRGREDALSRGENTMMMMVSQGIAAAIVYALY